MMLHGGNHRYDVYPMFYLLMLMIYPVHSQNIYQSLFVVSSPGTRFLPANIPAQFISEILVDSWQLCATECNNNPLCRVFDYGAIQPNGCLLFEGDIGILGSIIPSGVSDSTVGTIRMTSALFAGYGQPCSMTCPQSRYLTCTGKKSICDCMPHTYWDSSVGICLAQITIADAPCDSSKKMCREDYNLTCTPMNKCGSVSVPKPPVVISNTIADRNTVIEGSSSIGLQYPQGITVYDASDGQSILVVDSFRNEVIQMRNIDSSNKTISVLVGNWSGGSLNIPTYLFLDINNQNDLYVTDSDHQCVVLFPSMQVNDPPPVVVAGTTGSTGATLDRFVIPYGVAVDSVKNVYVADDYNHRIMLWAQTASSGIVVAGTGTEGNGSMELRYPVGVFLDESNALLYVADRDNHRVQLFNLTGTPPYKGSTVAGGNGVGYKSNQLYQPSDVWVSKKTGAVYIADSSNHRIQRWDRGAIIGVTVAGDPNGISGAGNTQLSTPSSLTINKNETRLYVSDTGNGRIQWFDLS